MLKDPFTFYFYLPDKLMYPLSYLSLYNRKLILNLGQRGADESFKPMKISLSSQKGLYESKKKTLIREVSSLNEEVANEMQYHLSLKV